MVSLLLRTYRYIRLHKIVYFRLAHFVLLINLVYLLSIPAVLLILDIK